MKSVIFDFDGVLGNTLEYVTEFVSKLTFRPKDQVRQLLLEMMMNNYKENFWQRYLKDMLASRLDKFLLNRSDVIFTERLEEIKNIKAHKAILSNNYSFICKNLLGDYANLFEIIVGDSEADTKVKGFEIILSSPGFSKANTIFITDSVGDIKEASQVLYKKNIYAVSWGYHSPNILKPHLSTGHILKNFENLEDILNKVQSLNRKVKQF